MFTYAFSWSPRSYWWPLKPAQCTGPDVYAQGLNQLVDAISLPGQRASTVPPLGEQRVYVASIESVAWRLHYCRALLAPVAHVESFDPLREIGKCDPARLWRNDAHVGRFVTRAAPRQKLMPPGPWILHTYSTRVDYTAEVFDQLQRLFAITGFHDHQLHCVLRFESGLDAEILKKSVIASTRAISILGCRYVDGGTPHWTSLDAATIGESFVVVRTDAELDEFIVTCIDECRGPQVKVCLLDGSPCAVALTMNHMVCDAADFKSYLYVLCKTYSGLLADEAYTRTAMGGDRSMREVLKRFGPRVELKSLFSQSSDNNRCGIIGSL